MPHPPRSLLGDSVMLRVAAGIYLSPGTAETLGEILASHRDVSRMTVIRALNDLVAQGYVLKDGTKPPRYRANPRHYLYDEVRSIALKTFGGFEPLALEIARSPGIAYAAIYGSYARGDASASSDVDVLLVTRSPGDPSVAAIVADLSAAARSLGREINPTVYDDEEFQAKKGTGFLARVLAGPLIVLKEV